MLVVALVVAVVVDAQHRKTSLTIAQNVCVYGEWSVLVVVVVVAVVVVVVAVVVVVEGVMVIVVGVVGWLVVCLVAWLPC